MTLISYAQNFEDVILWRALGHVENGFYIDIGAQDPLVDSVSLAFYERGWRGVHVEPDPTYAAKLRAARPDEEVLEAAIGPDEGEIEFFSVSDTGLSTGIAEIANSHRDDKFTVNPLKVKSIPLSNLLSSVSRSDVHWLKIDVEGMEGDVIDSWGEAKIRPWILVIESTVPLKKQHSHYEWDKKILSLEYIFVYFDGLNRFYLHKSKDNLLKYFGHGPNVFDDFALNGTASAPFTRIVNHNMKVKLEAAEAVATDKLASAARENEAMANELAQAKSMAEILLSEISLLEARVSSEKEQSRIHSTQALALAAELAALQASTSWKLTAPLRQARHFQRYYGHGLYAWATLKPGTRPRRLARRALFRLSRIVLARPALARNAKRVVRRFPALETRLANLIAHEAMAHYGLKANRLGSISLDAAQVGGGRLSPSGLRVLRDLKFVIDKRKD